MCLVEFGYKSFSVKGWSTSVKGKFPAKSGQLRSNSKPRQFLGHQNHNNTIFTSKLNVNHKTIHKTNYFKVTPQSIRFNLYQHNNNNYGPFKHITSNYTNLQEKTSNY